jgi:hypothetical protein
MCGGAAATDTHTQTDATHTHTHTLDKPPPPSFALGNGTESGFPSPGQNYVQCPGDDHPAQAVPG